MIAINARDDPFIEESSLPTKDDIKEAPVRCIYHDAGGHCGFIGKSNEYNIPSWGFIAEEMGRVIDHVHQY